MESCPARVPRAFASLHDFAPMKTSPDAPSRTENKRLYYLAIEVAAALFYLFFIFKNSFLVGKERFFSLFDDSMISMTYARNLAEGHGLVWNINQAPVEGYTNFLWTVIMAGIHLLGLPDSKTSLAVSLLGLVLLLLNLRVVRRLTEEAGLGVAAGIVAVALTAFYFPLIYWTLRGMEVGLLALLIGSGVLLALKLSRQFEWFSFMGLILVLVAAILTRPDAAAPVGFITMLLMLPLFRQKRYAAMLLLPLALAGVLAAQMVWRLHYYGDPVPNTYYLKVEGVSPWERFSRGIKCLVMLGLFHLWPLFVILAIGVSFRLKALFQWPALFLWGLLLVQFSYSIYVGGDAWEWMYFSNRYICIVMPMLFVLVGITLQEVAATASPRLSNLCGWLLPLGLAIQALYFMYEHKWGAAVVFGPVILLMLAVYFGISRKKLPLRQPLVMIIFLLFIVNFLGTSSWIIGKTNNGRLTREDEGAARIGLKLKATTTPDATIAVVWAGAIPYFSHRQPFDLLGKSDRYIAHGKPMGPFFPGHNKWNYPYTLEQEKPDIVLGLWMAKPEDYALLQKLGYVKMPDTGWYVRSDRMKVLVGPGTMATDAMKNPTNTEDKSVQQR
jgi:hypothetical protein